MSELIDRQAVLDALSNAVPSLTTPDGCGQFDRELQIVGEALVDAMQIVHALPTASPWHRVDEPPKEAGEYIVAYHPCWWNDVKWSVTEVGIDTFRGKTSWAKRKFQRVTHWMEKPEPPKEDA